jgi:TetR/AcrR family acrAB operon transcriptional repressor
MARRTKEEAEQTRLAIIAAARGVFQERGVTSTTLEHIAAAAGVTRGAIYWHFSNKHELFYAMREQVRLPMLERMESELLQEKQLAPLTRIEKFMKALLDSTIGTEAARVTFEIMNFKCEYVGEIKHELDEMRNCYESMLKNLTQVYRQAAREGSLRAGLKPEMLAIDSQLFLWGLARLWLIDTDGKLVRKQADKLIASHIATRRAN